MGERNAAVENIEALFEAWEAGEAHSPSAMDIVQAWAASERIAWQQVEGVKDRLADVADEILGKGVNDNVIAEALVLVLNLEWLLIQQGAPAR